MDPKKYNDLRVKVLETMNQHTRKRPPKCRRGSAPNLLIPSLFMKSVLSVEEENLKEMEQYQDHGTPPAPEKKKPFHHVRRRGEEELAKCMPSAVTL